MRVVFLYTELASYFITCCEALAQRAEVHIVRWPVNKEAPFNFKFSERLKIYDKAGYDLKDLKQLVAGIQPDILVCSGWIDKEYLKVVADYSGKVPTVMTCDTQWNGSMKQKLATIISRFYLLPKFSHAWVPGDTQKKYALKLGFKNKNILGGFYCCDLQKFNSAYKNVNIKERLSRKRFLYVGRYYDFKGVEDLWQAFIEFRAGDSEWELWCLGTGGIKPIEYPGIRHFGFVQPSELEPIINQCSVFVLPSRFEPWGVVVQEYAASGFPLVLSSAVGAASALMKSGENGFVFKAGDKAQLRECLKKMSELSDKQLISMSAKSHELAQQFSPESWAATIMDIAYEKQKK